MNRKVFYLKDNHGITLITLVVTMIVLIILVGVSINLILGENGIITKVKEGKQIQQEVEVQEKITMMLAEYVIEKEFNNQTLLEFLLEKKNNREIDEVIDNEDGTILVQSNGSTVVINKEEIKIKNISKSVKIEKNVTTITLDETEVTLLEGQTLIIVATVEPEDATNKEIQWISSDEEIAKVDSTGKITAEKAGNVTITAIAKDKNKIKATCSVEIKQPVDVTTIGKGIFVEYDVEYTDTYYSSYKYTSTNGWRLLSYKTRDDGKTLYDVQLISTGIPGIMYYSSGDTSNNYSKWVIDTKKINEFKALLGNSYDFYTGNSNYYALQASAGFYYNLGEMKFTQGTSNYEKNMGYYTTVKNRKTEYTSETITGNDLFKTREDASIRMLTLTELNTLLRRTDIDSINKITDTTGLFKLDELTSVLTGKSYSSGIYWLASPYPGNSKNVCRIGNSGIVDNYNTGGNAICGIRPVICLSSDIKFTQETDSTGLIYYKIW